MRSAPLAPFAKALRSAELRAMGRVVLHAFGVGLAVGAVACVFYTLLGVAERAVLEGIGGYEPLRPAGEHVLDFPMPRRQFSPLTLALIPAIGGLLSGLVAQRLAHETSGSDLHELPVVDGGKVVGLLDQAHITRAYHEYLGRLGTDAGDRMSALPSSRDLSK